jgi:hypothetical protein
MDAAGRIVGAIVMLEGIAFLAIIRAAITTTFVTRAQQEQQSTEQAEETAAETPIDPRLGQTAAHLDRVESLLQELTKRCVRDARPESGCQPARRGFPSRAQSTVRVPLKK